MDNAYTIKIVNHQGEEIQDRYSLRGGFGLTEDDVIYQAMQSALNDEDYYLSVEAPAFDESSDTD